MRPTSRHSLAVLGAFLFRWRSYLPALLAIPVALALPEAELFDSKFGESAAASWDIVSGAIAFVGLAVRAATIGFVPARTSGRNTREQRAEQLNTTAMYSIVRNPLYLGNVLVVFGLALGVKVWWLAPVVLGAAWGFYALVIRAEEEFLRDAFGRDYEAWRKVTPAIIPNLSHWRSSSLRFSFRNVLRREYNCFYLIIFVLTCLEVLTDFIGGDADTSSFLATDILWIWFFGLGTLAWVSLRAIKRRTRWLAVAGR